MDIKLFRYGYGVDSTGGVYHVNGEHFAYSCEDERREVKVPGETCIPPGRYEVKFRVLGSMHERYAEKFSSHRGMLHLQDVPGFEWVYIHIGNDEDDTAGCPLIGYVPVFDRHGREYRVGESTAAYLDLYQLVLLALDQGERIFIEVIEL